MWEKCQKLLFAYFLFSYHKSDSRIQWKAYHVRFKVKQKKWEKKWDKCQKSLFACLALEFGMIIFVIRDKALGGEPRTLISKTGACQNTNFTILIINLGHPWIYFEAKWHSFNHWFRLWNRSLRENDWRKQHSSKSCNFYASHMYI